LTTTFDLGALFRRFGLLIAIAVLVFGLALLSPQFLAVQNVLNLLLQATVNAIIAAGMTLVILTAGIDLSVGSVLALTAVITADVLQAGVPVVLAVVIGLGAGAVTGLVNGLLITLGRIPPFIATLGMMTLARGLALSYAQGRPITGLPDRFLLVGTSSMLGIPTPIWITAVVYGAGMFVLRRTVLGRYIYAIGNSSRAARFTGIPVRSATVAVYVISGALAALAGMILTARLNSAQPIMGLQYELNAIAAVVVGGAALSGGEGGLGGTFLGALLMAIIANAINILNISPFVAQVLQGSVILAALLLHGLSRRNQ
tara:strand:+ start:753 stop:1697 length:945 start_codon:yes stop_codon:yes gene_type:complete